MTEQIKRAETGKITQARLTVFGDRDIIDIYVPPVDEDDQTLAAAIKRATRNTIIPKPLEAWLDGSDLMITDSHTLTDLTKPALKLGELRFIEDTPPR